MQASIIIPTYNRKEILLKCLKAINICKYPLKKLEVIVVDDGSTDGTANFIENHRKELKFPLKILSQKNSGQGNARNFGIKHVENPIIIFLGDDIFVDKNCIAEHMKIHQKNPAENIAVLGFIEWSPEIHISPLMRWLSHGSNILGKYGGHQFAYEKLKNRSTADYNFFYTSNISLKKSLLEKDSFDPLFGAYGWEDIELGYRLTQKHHLKIRYNSRAIGRHYHEICLKDFQKRMFHIGRSAHIINRKYPELQKVPDLRKKIAFFLLSNQLSLAVLKSLSFFIKKYQPLYFYALSKKYFLKGLKK